MSIIKDSLSNVLSTAGGADFKNDDNPIAIKDLMTSQLSTNGDELCEKTLEVFGLIEKVRECVAGKNVTIESMGK
jgi:hypothetical protein